MKRGLWAVMHSFLLALYPIFALLAHNMGQAMPGDAVRAIAVSLLATAVLLLLGRWWLGGWAKAALATSLVLLLFFSYGQVYSAFENRTLLGMDVGRHRVLVVVWALILLGGLWWLARRAGDVRGLTGALNLASVVAVAFPILQLGLYLVRTAPVAAVRSASSPQSASASEIVPVLRPPEGQIPPDIYYIILDTYTREDVLKAETGFDNSSFIASLQKMGFYVARCSQSNYPDTEHSLSSSLNMAYLQDLGASDNGASLPPPTLAMLIGHSALRAALQRIGYRMIAFETGYSVTEWRDADVYLRPEAASTAPGVALGQLNPFEDMLLHTSAGVLIYEARGVLPQSLLPYLDFFDSAYMHHRNRILFTLDQLGTLPSIPGPKLVFAHILAPHPPFVFTADGRFVPRRTPFTLNGDIEFMEWQPYVDGYIAQATYLNHRLEALLPGILRDSPKPPIIIIQGDHGIPRLLIPSEKVSILNAYYLPGDGSHLLYPTISPVNTFRVVLDAYLGGNLALQKDLSYVPETPTTGGGVKFTQVVANSCPPTTQR